MTEQFMMGAIDLGYVWYPVQSFRPSEDYAVVIENLHVCIYNDETPTVELSFQHSYHTLLLAKKADSNVIGKELWEHFLNDFKFSIRNCKWGIMDKQAEDINSILIPINNTIVEQMSHHEKFEIVT